MAAEDLERIERELEAAGSGYEAARLQNRAGDLSLVKEDREGALVHYGGAIDAYLQAGEYDNAMAVCRKIIRMVPEVIRTRRTLAWLCLGKGFLEIAREHIDGYVQASIEADLQSLAAQQLQLMAQYVDKAYFREFLAGYLEDLGDEAAAKRVRVGEAIDSVREAGWATVVFAAMLTPGELRQAADEGVDIVAPAAGETIDGLDRYFIDPDQAGTEAADADDDEELDRFFVESPSAAESGEASAEETGSADTEAEAVGIGVEDAKEQPGDEEASVDEEAPVDEVEGTEASGGKEKSDKKRKRRRRQRKGKQKGGKKSE